MTDEGTKNADSEVSAYSVESMADFALDDIQWIEMDALLSPNHVMSAVYCQD